VEPDYSETLGLVAELAVALAGFSGVVVAFGSGRDQTWDPGDKLRLHFLVESSLTAGGFAILILVLMHAFPSNLPLVWTIGSTLWALFMPFSLYFAHLRIARGTLDRVDIDHFANRFVFTAFLLLIFLQIPNIFVWQDFGPLLAALALNLVGSGMQFAHLVNSAFRG
jgi:hypothetical protein